MNLSPFLLVDNQSIQVALDLARALYRDSQILSGSRR